MERKFKKVVVCVFCYLCLFKAFMHVKMFKWVNSRFKKGAIKAYLLFLVLAYWYK